MLAAFVGLGMFAINVYLFRSYGSGLFLATPFVMGAIGSISYFGARSSFGTLAAADDASNTQASIADPPPDAASGELRAPAPSSIAMFPWVNPVRLVCARAPRFSEPRPLAPQSTAWTASKSASRSASQSSPC